MDRPELDTTSRIDAIDYWCNMFTPDRRQLWERSVASQGIQVKIRSSDDDTFCTPEVMVARMDTVGIDTLLIPTCIAHVGRPELDFCRVAAATSEETAELAATYPDRFAGTWSVDPVKGMAGVIDARNALRDPWIVGLHLHTHSFDRSLDHADLYPFYALAAEHGVPMIMQAGSSGGLMPSACGHPIGIDRAALYFPDTPFVLSHLGWPWVDEAIAMALKFPNVYIGTAVYPARHWPESVRTFMRGPGGHKVLYATGFPTTGHRHTLRQLDETELSDNDRSAYLGGTARRIFTRLASVDERSANRQVKA